MAMNLTGSNPRAELLGFTSGGAQRVTAATPKLTTKAQYLNWIWAAEGTESRATSP